MRTSAPASATRATVFSAQNKPLHSNNRPELSSERLFFAACIALLRVETPAAQRITLNRAEDALAHAVVLLL